MKKYRGIRDSGGACKVTVVTDGRESPLRLRLDIRNHSPTGFEWGYGGSGPAQLALAILADATGDDDYAQKMYQDFKWKHTESMPYVGWTLSSSYVEHWVAQHPK